MKKLFFAAITTLFASSFFTSCTENTITNDEQVILEIQGIEHSESTMPGRKTTDEGNTNDEE